MLAMSLVMTTSCDDWTELNVNPNQPTEVPTTNVFGSGLMVVTRQFFGERIGIYYTGTWAGQTAAIGLGDYEFRVDINNSQWDELYRGMAYFVDAQKKAEAADNKNLAAVALIMKAYTAQHVSDMWGDVPYSQAFLLDEGVANPVFDSQEDVYTQILSELSTAHDMLQDGNGTIGVGDFLYGGNITKWKKFANSIRLRVAMRMSNVAEDVAKPILAQIINNPGTYPVIDDNADNAFLRWPGVNPDIEPWSQRLGSPTNKQDQYRSNHEMVSILKDYNDPRLPVYVDQNQSGEYNGYKMGPGQKGDPMNTGPNVSHIGNRFGYTQNGFSPLMRAAQVWFIKAEAFERGLATGDAQVAYETGIQRSMEENGIGNADITAYLAEDEVAWDGGTTSNLEKINLQNWLALFKHSVEAWAEVRRTDVPLITNVSEDYAVANHNRPPFRMAYPANESAHNTSFPFDVVQEDIFYGTQVWFDTRAGVQ